MAVTLVEKYNPEWPKWFEEIKAFLGEKVSQVCIQIEHVGSTSVPGMTAKPIIDLILVIDSQDFVEIKALLAERGYYHEGEDIPTGQTQFNFKEGDLKLHTICYEWLVITGAKAIFRDKVPLKKKLPPKSPFLRGRGIQGWGCRN